MRYRSLPLLPAEEPAVALKHLDVPLVHRSPGLPPLEDLIPIEWLVVQPTLFRVVVLAGKRVIHHILTFGVVPVGGDIDADPFTQWDSRLHPCLS